MTLYLVLTLILFAALAIILWPVWKSDAPKKQRLFFIAAVSAFFFIGGFGLYALVGSPQMVPLMAARDQKLSELKEIILRRSQEVKTDPKNLGAWVELGQSFMETGQFSAAANAFKRAVVLSQGNPVLILAYAQAQIEEAGGSVTDNAQKGLEMVLLQQPNNAEARYWLIVRELQDGKTETAMKEMKALYRSLPTDSPLKARIDRQIGRQ